MAKGDQEVERRLVIGTNKATGAFIRRQRADAITDEQWQCFLDHLAMTCNAKGAARAAEFHVGSAYRRKDRDPAFAAIWRQARETGMETVRTMLVARAMGTHSYEPGEDFAPDPATMDPVLGVQLVAQYEKALASNARGQSSAARGRVASEDEACAEILKRLKVLGIRLHGNKEQIG